MTSLFRAALAFFRRALGTVDHAVPRASADEAAAVFDALQRESYATGGWRGLGRCWASELAAIARLRFARAAFAPRAPWWRRLGAGLFIDVAAATRRLAVRPFATTGAALLIAIALGANVTAFAIARGVLWRGLPYPAADRLVTLWQFDKGETVQISYPDFADLRRNGSIDAGAALSAGVGTLVTGEPGVADRVQAVEAEPALFAMLGATPALGRLLTADDGGKPFAMISHRLWQTRFGADASVVGRSFTLSGRVCTVVGVLPAGFDLELPVSAGFTLDHADIWTSFDSTYSVRDAA